MPNKFRPDKWVDKKAKIVGRPITADNDIHMYLHCSLCLEDIPDGVSPREWSQIEVGFTPIGLQVWCKRHEANMAHIDFEGETHPANMQRLKKTLDA